jgi:hypothetical protein
MPTIAFFSEQIEWARRLARQVTSTVDRDRLRAAADDYQRQLDAASAPPKKGKAQAINPTRLRQPAKPHHRMRWDHPLTRPRQPQPAAHLRSIRSRPAPAEEYGRCIAGLTFEETIEFEALEGLPPYDDNGNVGWTFEGEPTTPREKRWLELYSKHEKVVAASIKLIKLLG